MNYLTPHTGYLIIGTFAFIMLGITYFTSRNKLWTNTQEGFLYAGRNVSALFAAFSIAASWIWAPALFVSVQKSYELGLPGLFWFTFPNVIAVILYAFLGPAIRRKIPGGFSIPDWVKYRFEGENKKLSRWAHQIYMAPYLWYQLMAITVQIFVGGMIFNFITGVPLNIAMPLLLVVALSYSLISGLRASIITDFIQMTFILLGLIVIVPWCLSITGIPALEKGLGGLAGNTNILDPAVAFSFGIVTSIGLIAGSISDQQFWQRCFSIEEKSLTTAFIWGGLIFAVVPIGISILGFLAANPDLGIALPEGTGLPMIGIATVFELLPLSAGVFFVVMLLSGLMSTLDSAFAATASLYTTDMRARSPEYKKTFAKERLGEKLTAPEQKIQDAQNITIIRHSRLAMVGIAILGLLTAFVVQHLFSLDRLWWIFNGVATMFVVPTVLSIFWDRLSIKGVLYGLVGSTLCMGIFVYGNAVQDTQIVVYSALGIVGVNLFFCTIFKRKTAFK